MGYMERLSSKMCMFISNDKDTVAQYDTGLFWNLTSLCAIVMVQYVCDHFLLMKSPA